MHLYINFEYKNLSVAFHMNQSEQDFLVELPGRSC